MKTRSKFWAMLGAGVLTLGVVSIAMAIELKEAHQGITITWDAEGNPQVDGFDALNTDECDAEPGEGEVIFHFVQSGQGVVAGAAGTNMLTAEFTGADDVGPQAEDTIQGNGSNVDWYIHAIATGSSLVLDTANSNLDGGELRVSHICAGTNTPEPTPTFEETEEANTDAPTEPTTDMTGTNGPSGPADGAWLLVVALGVLLASVVVLTPARAKSQR